MKKPDDAGYEVGYGKPPRENRFKKGSSGNPKGRPKGKPNLSTTFQKACFEKIVVMENGRRRQVTKLEAAVTQLVNKAVKGDARAMQQVLSIAPLLDSQPAALATHEMDQAVMAGLVKRMTRAEGEAT